MSLDQKYFPQDKNYLLKTVQAFSKEVLISGWADHCYQGYMRNENPMGLEDDFTIHIKSEIQKGTFILEEVYELLSAIYRFREGDNQLSFVWDGRTHMEYYDEKWKITFIEWVDELSRKPEIYRAVIKASLADGMTNTTFLQASIKRAVLNHFHIRLTRSQKIHTLTA